ncbi:MAG: alpha/beta hydrolase [Xanthomonadales bacterium]|nr:alpha/beta hydrolase [Xanthomonadales bacterium]
MKKLWLRITGTLILLAAVVLVGAWAYFNEEHLDLDATTRSQFDESFIELPAGVVHYQLAGPADGETVVLVHGFSVPAYIWDPTFEFVVSAGYRVLRFDLYGRGHSDRPDTEYDFPFFVSQLEQLTTALELTAPFNLVGLSMGGPVSAYFTNAHPEKVSQVILFDPMVVAPSAEDISLLTRPVIGEYMANVYLMPQLASGQTDDFKDKARFPDWESRFREQMQYRGFRRAILSTIRQWPGADILGEYEKLGDSGIPVHLFWGREDRTVPLALSEKVLERVPQARLTVIDGAGHLPHYEQPETVNPLLLDLLTGRAKTAPPPQ